MGFLPYFVFADGTGALYFIDTSGITMRTPVYVTQFIFFAGIHGGFYALALF